VTGHKPGAHTDRQIEQKKRVRSRKLATKRIQDTGKIMKQLMLHSPDRKRYRRMLLMMMFPAPGYIKRSCKGKRSGRLGTTGQIPALPAARKKKRKYYLA